VLVFTLFAAIVWQFFHLYEFHSGMAVAPYEIIGVVLALLLVQRTNAGYDRWYEGRKLWGGIVNQSRNLGLIGAVYGPQNAQWQSKFARWIVSFSHVCRHSLRDEDSLDDLTRLLGKDEVARLAAASHMPSYIAGKIAGMMHAAVNAGTMDRFAFLQGEHERALLIDHIGACERIIRTPLAEVFSIKIRRFLFLYLTMLPIAIVDKVGIGTPLVVLLVAYPLLSLDQIGIELQNPFDKGRLSHLPLDEISQKIEGNVLGYFQQSPFPELADSCKAEQDAVPAADATLTLADAQVAFPATELRS
jgi:putative membrane protein